MKRVIYLVTFKTVGSAGSEHYGQARLAITEDLRGKASDRYEDFMKALEETSGYQRHMIIIINSIKFE